jgi:hypothetical protein
MGHDEDFYLLGYMVLDHRTKPYNRYEPQQDTNNPIPI